MISAASLSVAHRHSWWFWRIVFITATILFALTAAQTARAQSDVRIEATAAPALAEAIATTRQQGGELRLAPGDYGLLRIWNISIPPDTPMTLRSLDPSNPARITGLDLREVENLILDGLIFDYTFAIGDPPHARPFRISGGKNITIRNSLFDGDVAQRGNPTEDGFGNGNALLVHRVQGFSLENSELRGFRNGLGLSLSQDARVSRNDIHSMRSDGMTFSQMDGLLIERNHIHNFDRSLASGDHSDMIQFWTTGTTAPSRSIVIRDNVLDSGEGWHTQSIFMGNELAHDEMTSDAFYYRDVLIEGNVIRNAHLHGISVGQSHGLTIRNNTLVRNPGSVEAGSDYRVSTPAINLSPQSTEVHVLRNVTGGIDGVEPNTKWQVVDNLVVQDRARMEPNFYNLVFADPFLTGQDAVWGFAPRPGGPLDGTEIGAPLLTQ